MAVNFEIWISGRMAEHQRAEAARNAPISRAYDALTTLREALDELAPGTECDEILREMRVLIADTDAGAWQSFAAAFAIHQEG